MKIFFLFIVVVVIPEVLFASTADIEYKNQAIVINKIEYKAKIPKGYQLEILTTDLDSPRMMAFTRAGELLIGSKSGKIYRLRKPYTNPEVIAELPDYPHSVIARGKFLYIAQTNGLYVTPYRAGQKYIPKSSIEMYIQLPGGGGHNSRTVKLGADKKIYVSLGITGNCSNEYLDKSYPVNDRRGGVLVLNEKNKLIWETYASGLRNPVGFDWHPGTNIMYASNNGPDHHGYEQPPEYFSRVEKNSFHGMPWYQYDGVNIIRDDCIDSEPPVSANKVVMPVLTFPARNAPMGVAFINNERFGTNFINDAVIALRGSWGTKPSGGFFGSRSSRRHPKLVIARFNNEKAVRVDDLVTGFQLKNGKRWLRPVGVTVGHDGALYFTSDGGIDGLYRLKKVDKQFDHVE